MRRTRLFFIGIMCCLTIALASSFSFALDKDVDTGIISENISYIANAVDQYGYTNNNGYRAISHNPKSGTSCLVEHRDNDLYFSLYLVEDDGTESFAYMTVPFPYGERYPVTAHIYNLDSDGNVVNGIEADAIIDPSDYIQNEEILIFYPTNTGYDNSTVQNWCNWTFDYAIDCWDELLENKIGVSIVNLGFSEICNHSWNDTIVKKATCTQAGQRKFVCECGKVRYETIPATGHNYGNWKTKKKATELASGLKTRTCSACKKEDKQTIKQIKPSLPSVAIVKPVAAKKSATIKWKKVSKANQKKIASIQIQYSTDKFFKKVLKLLPQKKLPFRKRFRN